MNRLPNYHALTVTYLAVTNTCDARVKIHSARYEESVIIPYNHEISGGTLGIAQAWLDARGYTLIGTAEAKRGYTLISTTFRSLVDAAASVIQSGVLAKAGAA